MPPTPRQRVEAPLVLDHRADPAAGMIDRLWGHAHVAQDQLTTRCPRTRKARRPRWVYRAPARAHPPLSLRWSSRARALAAAFGRPCRGRSSAGRPRTPRCAGTCASRGAPSRTPAARRASALARAPRPTRRTTNALVFRSPSSSTPMTAACSTASCRIRHSSTSTGATHRPLTLSSSSARPAK